MKIKKIDIMNFMGLAGKHSYDLDQITALCQSNGAGKTSLICALRYALTGYLPAGNAITHGRPYAAVKITTESGTTYMRQKYAKDGRAARCVFNDKVVPTKQLNDYIEQETGVPINTAKIATAGELLTSLSSQQFGELILRYLPEQLTRDIILERMGDIPDSQKKIVTDILPDGEFGTPSLDDAYNTLTDRRRFLKKTIAEKKAILQNYAATTLPDMAPDEIQKQIDELTAKRDASVIYDTQKKAYDQAVADKNRYDNSVAVLEKQIAAISAHPHTDDELAELIKKKTDLMTALTQFKTTYNQELAIAKDLQIKLSSFGDETIGCRWAKEHFKLDIPCSENMAKHADKFATGLEKLKDELKAKGKMYQKQIEEYRSLEGKLEVATKEVADAKRKNDLQKQLDEMKKLAPTVPEVPVQAEALSVLDAKLKSLRKILNLLQNKGAIDKTKETIAECENKLVDYEFLVSQFSPKGAVKEAVVNYYLDSFTDEMNRKADELLPGMKVKFVTDNGVSVLTDIHGTGTYLSYSSLSGGEKANVMFLLLDLLSTLSGLRVLLLDELSVLDKKSFEHLLSVICLHKDDYDMIILSAVNNETYKTIFEKEKIKIMTI